MDVRHGSLLFWNYNMSKKIKYRDYKCACTGNWCEGECRQEHLYNKRTLGKLGELCSAVYKERKGLKK